MFSGHDQLVNILKFKIPVEIVIAILSYLPTTLLVECLETTFDQLMHYSINIKWLGFRNQLKNGFSIDHDGNVFLINI